MENCKNCGKEMTGLYGDCDGVLTFDVDPYKVEINEDYTKFWDCAGNRYESAMDI